MRYSSVQKGGYVGGDSQSAAPAQSAPAATKKDELDTIDYGEVINPDDIPF